MDPSGIRRDADPEDPDFALRLLPLRAIVALDLIARHDCRLHLAAQAQNISTSALSTQITRLEARLRADIVRNMPADHRRLELTENGEMLVKALRAAVPALQHLSDTVRLVSDSTASNTKDGGRERPTRHNARRRQSAAKALPPV